MCGEYDMRDRDEKCLKILIGVVQILMVLNKSSIRQNIKGEKM
jgi:hypothetical protein